MSEKNFVSYGDAETLFTGIDSAFDEKQAELNRVFNDYGAKNLLKVDAHTETVGDLTFTVYSDGRINVSGTQPTEDYEFSIGSYRYDSERHGILTDYWLSGGINENVFLRVWISGSAMYYRDDTGSGIKFDLSRASRNASFKIVIKGAGEDTPLTINETLYPMFRYDDVSNAAWRPYAMTNEELTSAIGNKADKSAATTNDLGLVKPDGTTITVDNDGTIHGASGIPVGSTVTPICDIQTWLHCAGIGSKNYTTLVQILSDEVTLATLMSNSNAADYLVRSTDWANTICADSTAMSYIGENDYCAVTLLTDNTWRSAICNSAYFESVLNVKVPTMTSNTAPIGECSGSGYTPSVSGGGDYFNAFDGNHNTWWNSDVIPTTSNPEYIEYVFPHAIAVNKVAWSPYSSSVYPIQMKLKASNDGNTWTEIADITGTGDDSQSANIVGQTAYTHWAIFVYEHQSSDRGMFRDLQFYGRSLADAEPDGMAKTRYAVSSGNWSASANASGYYTYTVSLGKSVNIAYSPTVYIAGASDSTFPTDAERAQYSRLDESALTAANTVTLYAKTKPTSTFYVFIEIVSAGGAGGAVGCNPFANATLLVEKEIAKSDISNGTGQVSLTSTEAAAVLNSNTVIFEVLYKGDSGKYGILGSQICELGFMKSKNGNFIQIRGNYYYSTSASSFNAYLQIDGTNGSVVMQVDNTFYNNMSSSARMCVRVLKID